MGEENPGGENSGVGCPSKTAMEDYTTREQDGFDVSGKGQHECPREMAEEVIESFAAREIEAIEITEDSITAFGGPIE